MSLTSTAPPSLPLHVDRPHQSSMSYPPTDGHNYQGYYGRPVSAHGIPPPQPLDVSSPDRLHSAGGYKSAVPPSPIHIYPHDAVPPSLGSANGYTSTNPITPVSGSGYPPESPVPPTYPTMAPPNPDAALPTPPLPAGTAAGSRPGTGYASETTAPPVVPVGISGGKMFRCRGFGDCDKVFTRSEHLARHVRKHTGERPFPCHCGKAFSRLDNLRQHAATVHADSTQMNEQMLANLASVHAQLSQRANREQRRRGEVVEVPKNAVERPRGERVGKGPAVQAPSAIVPPPGTVYTPGPGYHPGQQWGAPPPPDHSRPRTAGSWVEYPPYAGPVTPVGEHPPPTAGSVAYSDDAGPSRRPPSAGYPGYYEGGPGSSYGRPGTGNPAEDPGALPYGYRPMSASGPPGHYADSEPPSSAHGPPPHSPLYPHAPPAIATAGNWTSPPTPHSGYPADASLYSAVPPDGGAYPPGQAPDGHYGPPPPGSSGGYYPYPPHGHGYYGQQSPATQHAPAFPTTPGVVGTPTSTYPPGHYAGAPPDSPFQYNAGGSYPYPPGSGPYDTRKRRAEDEVGGDRKHPRTSAEGAPASAEPRAPGAQGDLWLPPTSERRSSLAISALLGSPTNSHSRRPAEEGAAPAYPYPEAPFDDRTGAARDRPVEDEKPKALVAE